MGRHALKSSRQAAPYRLAATIWLLLLSGCAGVYSFSRPEVTLADIEVRQVRTMETALLVQLRITNPNERPLDIEGLSCELELEGHKFATGLQGERTTIPPYSSALVPVEVYASVLEMFSSILGLIEHADRTHAPPRAVGYRLTGKVRITSGALSRNLPFESAGQLKF